MKAKEAPIFIDPTTDVGFKRLFGDKQNLINFLNIIFRGRKNIIDLTYRDTERVGRTEEIGTVIFDLMVETSSGEEIIMEMQTTSHANLKKRMLYYASRLISDKAPVGDRRGWGYALPEVYTIVLMDGFRLPESNSTDFFHDICLCNRDSGEIFYEGFGFIYLELINFEKSEEESETTDLDKVFFMLKNMSSLKTLPRILDSGVFKRFFQLAKYAKLTKEEQRMYDISLKRKWDAEAVRLFREEEDARRKEEDARREEEMARVNEEAAHIKEEAARIREEAAHIQEEAVRIKEEAEHRISEERVKMETEKLEAALKLKRLEVPIADIAESLGLSVEQVEKLK